MFSIYLATHIFEGQFQSCSSQKTNSKTVGNVPKIKINKTSRKLLNFLQRQSNRFDFIHYPLMIYYSRVITIDTHIWKIDMYTCPSQVFLEKLKTTKSVDKNINWVLYLCDRTSNWLQGFFNDENLTKMKMYDRNVATIVLWVAKLINKQLWEILWHFNYIKEKWLFTQCKKWIIHKIKTGLFYCVSIFIFFRSVTPGP